MILTIEQLILRFRSDVFDMPDIDDAGVPRDTLWSDEDALWYANSAAARLASDTLALRRRFQFSVLAGEPLIRFPYTEILDDILITFNVPGMGRSRVLREFDIDQGIVRDDYGLQVYTVPDLEATGQPTHFTRDYDNQFLRLWPIPFAAGTLQASAITLPQEMHPGMVVPFSAQQDIDLLLMWMKKLAYSKQDADTLDLERAKEFEAEYLRYMPDRRSEIDRIRRDGGIVRPS